MSEQETDSTVAKKSDLYPIAEVVIDDDLREVIAASDFAKVTCPHDASWNYSIKAPKGSGFNYCNSCMTDSERVLILPLLRRIKGAILISDPFGCAQDMLTIFVFFDSFSVFSVPSVAIKICSAVTHLSSMT